MRHDFLILCAAILKNVDSVSFMQQRQKHEHNHPGCTVPWLVLVVQASQRNEQRLAEAWRLLSWKNVTLYSDQPPMRMPKLASGERGIVSAWYDISQLIQGSVL